MATPKPPNNNNKALTTAKTLISTAGSLAATAMLVRTIINDFLPHEINTAIFSNVRDFLTRLLTNHFTLVIDQFDGLVKNELYESALLYIRPKIDPKSRRLKISKPEKEANCTLSMLGGEEFVDVFNGEKFKWVWLSKKNKTSNLHNTRQLGYYQSSETRSFQLTFHKKNKDFVVNSYLPYVTKQAQVMKQENRTVKIFTIDFHRGLEMGNIWKPVTLDHPATFDTLAMDSEKKEMILSDLDRFMERREYYRRVGKAWKRGYLLYGPPGTGKSSLIAAIANYLKFDVYDLELAALKHDSELRRLLLGTANKSILVVEDIDCTIDVQDQLGNRGAPVAGPFGPYGYPHDSKTKTKVTLSGLLNFVDGLWSSCGDERIIIFTTNNVEKLDPALLRPGRMDVHIHLSYCTPCGFKLLASNYLGIEEHAVFEEIEGLIPIAKVTPAEVAEYLLKNDDPDVAFQGLIGFMQKKIKENEEAEAAEKLKAEAAAEKQKEEADAEKLKAEAGAEKLKADAVAEKLKAVAVAEKLKAVAVAEKLKLESGEVLKGESAEKSDVVQQGEVKDEQASAVMKLLTPEE